MKSVPSYPSKRVSADPIVWSSRRHVAVVDTNRPFYDVVIGAEGVAKTFFAANGSLSRAEVEQYLSGNHSSLPVKFSVPSTRAVYGRIGLESDVGDDALDGRPTTYVSPPPSMHIQEPRSLVLSRLTPAFVNRFFKNRNAARVHYEVVLRVVWQSSCGSRTMERS